MPSALPPGNSRQAPPHQHSAWDDTAGEEVPRDGLHAGHPSVPEGAASVPGGSDDGGAAQAMRGMLSDRGVAGSLGAPMLRPAWQEGDLEEAQIEILRRPDGALYEIGSGAYGKARAALEPCRHNRGMLVLTQQRYQRRPGHWLVPAGRPQAALAGRRREEHARPRRAELHCEVTPPHTLLVLLGARARRSAGLLPMGHGVRCQASPLGLPRMAGHEAQLMLYCCAPGVCAQSPHLAASRRWHASGCQVAQAVHGGRAGWRAAMESGHVGG